MKKYDYSRCCIGFDLGDEVETMNGIIGKITFICPCERCAERGAYDVIWETMDGKDSYCIDADEVNDGLPHYRRIGDQVLEHEPFCAPRRQISFHRWLHRKLLKFTYDNKCEDTAKWNGVNKHYCIAYNIEFDKVDVTYCFNTKFSVVYFSSEEAAEQAIKEVVEPFMKAYPEFVW